jgi:hypothetical protein
MFIRTTKLSISLAEMNEDTSLKSAGVLCVIKGAFALHLIPINIHGSLENNNNKQLRWSSTVDLCCGLRKNKNSNDQRETRLADETPPYSVRIAPPRRMISWYYVRQFRARRDSSSRAHTCLAAPCAGNLLFCLLGVLTAAQNKATKAIWRLLTEAWTLHPHAHPRSSLKMAEQGYDAVAFAAASANLPPGWDCKFDARTCRLWDNLFIFTL